MSDESPHKAGRSLPGVETVLGLAQEAVSGLGEVVPKLVERSKKQASFALAVVERLRCGSAPEPSEPVVDEADAEGAVGGGDGDAASSTVTEIPRPRPVAVPDLDDVEDGPLSSTLAIPDYDSLAASQVLPRLRGLTNDELEAIRAYEAANRNRRTILGRLTQLLA